MKQFTFILLAAVILFGCTKEPDNKKNIQDNDIKEDVVGYGTLRVHLSLQNFSPVSNTSCCRQAIWNNFFLFDIEKEKLIDYEKTALTIMNDSVLSYQDGTKSKKHEYLWTNDSVFYLTNNDMRRSHTMNQLRSIDIIAKDYILWIVHIPAGRNLDTFILPGYSLSKVVSIKKGETVVKIAQFQDSAKTSPNGRYYKWDEYQEEISYLDKYEKNKKNQCKPKTVKK